MGASASAFASLGRASGVPESPWPGGAPFGLALTHDVDRIRKTYHYVTFLRKRSGWRQLVTRTPGGSPYWNFGRIMALERSFGVRSTFLFIEESRGIGPRPLDWVLALGKYKFADDRIAGVIQTLDKEGWEVGLHGSYDSFRDESKLRTEKRHLEDVLGHPVAGIRQHFLNLDVPATWALHRKVGLEYDCTLGFRDRVGFQGLPLFPFAPFQDAFLAVPMAVMDTALFSSAPSEARARRRIEEIVEEATRSHALLVVLWHQNLLNGHEFPREYRTYESLLGLARRRGAWIVPAGEVAAWWRREDPLA